LEIAATPAIALAVARVAKIPTLGRIRNTNFSGLIAFKVKVAIKPDFTIIVLPERNYKSLSNWEIDNFPHNARLSASLAAVCMKPAMMFALYLCLNSAILCP
jgi:hypothetical protein